MKKRAFERVNSNIQLRFSYNNSIYSGIVTNLSKNGMRINTHNCPPVKSKFEVLFPLKKEILPLPVRVIRLLKIHDTVDAMGVELLNPSIKYFDFISDFGLESLSKFSGKTKQEANIYTCTICGHIVFEQMPMECPICMASIENFEYNPNAVKKPGSPENLSEFEKKHIPVIAISKGNGSISDNGYNVHVKVGEIKHPMEIEDHITFIDYYLQASDIKKRCVGRAHLRCNKIQPSVMFYLNNLTSATLTVISTCTAHGSWMNQAKI